MQPASLSHKDTLEEHAQEAERQIAFDRHRAAFQREPGVQAVQQELSGLKQAISSRATCIKDSSSIRLEVGERQDGFWLIGLGRALTPVWKQKFFNTLDDARLEVRLFNVMPPLQWMFEKPTIVKTLIFTFELLPGDVSGWVSVDGRRRTFTTVDLAEHLLKFYLENGRNL